MAALRCRFASQRTGRRIESESSREHLNCQLQLLRNHRRHLETPTSPGTVQVSMQVSGGIERREEGRERKGCSGIERREESEERRRDAAA